VDASVFPGEVEAPVGVEVAVGPQCPQLEDGFGAVQAPAGAGDVEPVADKVPAGPFDHAGGDRPAAGQGGVVAQRLPLGGEVADAGIDAAALVGGEAGVGGLRAEGKSPKEALRCLKRRLSDAVYRCLLADQLSL
jgi:hypothetical protein